jgi:hypothetical protein
MMPQRRTKVAARDALLDLGRVGASRLPGSFGLCDVFDRALFQRHQFLFALDLDADRVRIRDCPVEIRGFLGRELESSTSSGFARDATCSA